MAVIVAITHAGKQKKEAKPSKNRLRIEEINDAIFGHSRPHHHARGREKMINKWPVS